MVRIGKIHALAAATAIALVVCANARAETTNVHFLITVSVQPRCLIQTDRNRLDVKCVSGAAPIELSRSVVSEAASTRPIGIGSATDVSGSVRLTVTF